MLWLKYWGLGFGFRVIAIAIVTHKKLETGLRTIGIPGAQKKGLRLLGFPIFGLLL